jgi:hypothetical protein
MVAIIKNQFRYFNAANFLEAFSEASPNLIYLGIGKPLPWTDETVPDAVTDKRTDEITDWQDMIALKNIISSNVSHVIPRYDWTINTVYGQYDDTSDDITSNSPTFYVVTNSYNVYKCISNNGGGVSTTEPTGVSTSDITTADGYIWKFMYDISSSQLLKFFTTDWMPVPTAGNRTANQTAIVASATEGAIHHVIVTAAGSGYTSVPTVAITGDGTGATATATIASGAVTSIIISAQGYGYSYSTVTLTGGGGTGASVRGVISPSYGHGFDSVEELGAYYAMCSVDLEQGEGGNFPTTNNFRKLVLVKDPNLLNDSSAASATSYDQRTYIRFAAGTATGTFVEDEWVYQGASLAAATAKGLVVSYDATTKELSLTNVTRVSGAYAFPHFQSNLDVTGDTSGATGLGSSSNASIVDPDMEPDSGDIMYTEHRRSISRSSDQTENVRLIIEF